MGSHLFGQSVVEKRTELVRIANSYVGIKEATGRNDGAAVLHFQKTVGLKSGAGWCGAFAATCHIEAKIQCPKTGVAANWFQSNVVYKRNVPRMKEFKVQPGQSAGFVYGKRIGHVSIIAKEHDKLHYLTIGGNETNGVRKSIVKKTSVWVISDYCDPFEPIKKTK